MHEGWYGDDYLIIFSESEIADFSDRYAASIFLPGYRILGLRGWDDFIVEDANGGSYSVPTVPLDRQHLAPFNIPPCSELVEEERFRGKIKWYLMPIVFGGDSRADNNMNWVNHEQHAQLVRWWNDLYRSLRKPHNPIG